MGVGLCQPGHDVRDVGADPHKIAAMMGPSGNTGPRQGFRAVWAYLEPFAGQESQSGREEVYEDMNEMETRWGLSEVGT